MITDNNSSLYSFYHRQLASGEIQVIPLIGNIALILSLLFVVLQITANPRFYRIGAASVFLLVLISFLCLVYSYVTSDFSVLNVYNNSHTLKPFIYKITGAWGNHEGSMLLLVLILVGYNFVFVVGGFESVVRGSWLVVRKESHEPQTTNHEPIFTTAYLTQLIITCGFLAFIIITSNPFQRIFPAPENGLGLNPLLQDVGLAIHPPMLYLGYIGFSVAFSFAIAALIHGDVSGNWASNLRKWVLASWGLLTLGIGLGSWWAYRELGWGGFWFWDPVENVSVMPWLSAIALYHSLIVLEKRKIFAVWSVLLAIITFILSLIGIFLVRSGVASSVHAFASDPSRGVFILIFLCLVGASAFTLFAMRAHKLVANANFYPLSRETMMLVNNIFFVTLSATVLLGTLYPIFLEVFGGVRVSVGAPYFNATFNSIAILMLVFAGTGPAISWGGNDQPSYIKKLLIKNFLPLVVGALVGVVVFIKNGDTITIASIAIAMFLLVATIQITLDNKLRLKKLSRRAYAMILAHSGAAILVIGIAVTSFFGVEKEQVMQKGEKISFANYEAVLVGGELGMGKNYIFRHAHFRILEKNNEIANLYPEIRVYPVEGSSTLEAAIYYSLFSNIYVAMGEVDKEGEKYAVRVYYKPMVNLIWLGCVMMALGGILAVFNQQKRI